MTEINTDTLYNTIEWHPIQHGATNLVTRKMRRPRADLIVFKLTLQARLVIGLLLLVCLFLLWWAGHYIFTYAFGEGLSRGEILGLGILIVTMLSLSISLILRQILTLISFDKQTQIFAGRILGRWTLPGLQAAFADIFALQLIEKQSTIRHRNRTQQVYGAELNLILADGSRMTVLDQGKLDTLRSDAQILAEFLGVPLWQDSQDMKTAPCQQPFRPLSHSPSSEIKDMRKSPAYREQLVTVFHLTTAGFFLGTLLSYLTFANHFMPHWFYGGLTLLGVSSAVLFPIQRCLHMQEPRPDFAWGGACEFRHCRRGILRQRAEYSPVLGLKSTHTVF